MIGKNIAQFRIDEKLGQGGMGIVYKAHDTKLNRTVALKFLPAHMSGDDEAKARFIQEAQSASSLDHPNICTIYEIGETEEGDLFIAMAFYDGKTLKYALEGESLTVEKATSIIRQIARALERAHEAGIVHRDVKPANIMVTSRGEIKLLDFGLAKLAGGGDLTKMGSTVGTAAYMSPEQMKGGEITSAADVWSLGALYFELITGTRPFRGDYDQALMYSILNETPEPVSALREDVPQHLSDLINRCLQKEPSLRPTSAQVVAGLGDGSSAERVAAGSSGSRVAAAPAPAPFSSNRKKIGGVVVLAILAMLAFVLWPDGSDSGSGASSTATTAIDRSVAVLPFSVRSVEQGSDAEVLAGGIHDDLLAQLARISDLRVISRTSVIKYENTTKSVSEIADELGVATVLEGTLQRAGDRVRVNVSLIDAASDASLWSDTYDQELTAANIFAIQSDLAVQIAGALNASLSAAQSQQLRDAPQISMEAYDLYTQAMYIFMGSSFGVEAPAAAELMERVVEMEPDYARAHAALARIYLDGVRNSMFENSLLENARSHIETALSLEPDMPDAWIERGALLLLELDYDGAEAAIEKAIELAPGDSRPHFVLSSLLYTLGRPNDALQSARRAVELDPLDIDPRARLADVLFFVDDFQGSLAESEKVLLMDPNHSTSYYNIGYCYAMMGRMDDSIDAFERAVALEGNDILMKMGLAWAHAKAGDEDEALAIISEVEDNPTMLREKAIIHGILGNLDTAFEMLDRAMELNPGVVAIIAGDSSVPLEMRSDPRFVNLMERLGLRQ